MVFGKKSSKKSAAQEKPAQPAKSEETAAPKKKSIFGGGSSKKESSVFIQRGLGWHFLLNIIFYMLGMGLTITMVIVAMVKGDGWYLRFGGLFIFAILAIIHAVWIIVRPNKFKVFGMAASGGMA